MVIRLAGTAGSLNKRERAYPAEGSNDHALQPRHRDPEPDSGHRDRRSDQLERDFRYARKSGHHPSESPVNIVGFGGHHPSESPVTFRRNTQVPKDTAPILYTSCEREGALAEIAFHWAQLTPLPSKPVALHRLRLTTKRTMRLLRANLETFGVTWERYGELNYARTQEIGVAVAFLGYDGLLAPSARWACENLMLFLDNHRTEENAIQMTHTEEVDWLAWARSHGLVSAGE